MNNPTTKTGLRPFVFAFGVSGSGKSRIGWHVYESLRASTTTPMLVGYTAVEDWNTEAPAWMEAPHSAAEEKRRNYSDLAAAARRLVAIIVENNHTSSDYKKRELPGHHHADGEHDSSERAVDELEAVLRDWAGAIRLQAGKRGKGLPVCLIIHLDEFHLKPWAAACMARAIRSATAHLNASSIRAMPLLTGSEIEQTVTHLSRNVFLATGTSLNEVHLQYLDPQSHAAKRILISGFNAVAGKGAPALTVADIDGMQELQLLLETAGGWTLGLVRLGAATASRAVLEGGIYEVNWFIVEEDSCDAVRIWFEAQTSRTHGLRELSAAAWRKLLLLTMAPFTVSVRSLLVCVCLCVYERVCRCLCASGLSWVQPTNCLFMSHLAFFFPTCRTAVGAHG